MKTLLVLIILLATLYKSTHPTCSHKCNVWKPNLSPLYIYTQTWTKHLKRSIMTKADKNNSQFKCLLNLVLLLAGDIQQNPGPQNRNITVNPCGLCDRPVTWSCEGVCCDDCNIWHHRSCIELCSHDYELLHRSNVQWMCCKCESMNVDSFTYHSFELYTTNMFSPLSRTDFSIDSDLNTSVFNPVHTSSPKSIGNRHSRNSKRSSNLSKSTNSNNSNVLNLPPNFIYLL
ncbi:unnamed protein product [Mytilus edulis]|uniref:PHD-type domain-containing protein n=1 Tax=Mytilus edulis TaxID=6550 RepID=A0A8S3VFL4_MYTED|nr:unnamed protein product [Mytilus edulis]